MRTSKCSPRIRGELEGGKIKPVSFSTKASGIVKYLEKPKLKLPVKVVTIRLRSLYRLAGP